MKLLVALLCVICMSLPAQSVTTDQRKEADTFFQQKNWTAAASAYSIIAKSEPQNWNAKMRWGVALKNSGKLSEALPLLEEAQKLAPNPQTFFYLASAQAANGNIDAAFDWLDKAITSGAAFLDLFESDAGFAAHKNDPRYKAGHDRLRRNVYPCQLTPEANQFDFWVGEWEVRNPFGAFAGKSKIEKILNDCVILENWTSALPNMYSGKSFNAYNSVTKKWMQTWVDDKGGITEYVDGEYKDSALVLATRPDANNQVTRLSFFNISPSVVRQLFEVSSDNGKTWKTTTDLYYYRVK